MITVDNFSSFLGLGKAPSPAKKAVGLITVTQLNPSTSLDIQQDTQFIHVSGAKFRSTELVTISESQSFGIVALQAEEGGVLGNIPAGDNSDWTSQIPSIEIQNQNPFTGGVDEQATIKGLYPNRGQFAGYSPEMLERALNVSKAVVRGLIGLQPDEELDETDVRVCEGVYLLAMYRLQNNWSQVLEYPLKSQDEASPLQTKRFMDRLYNPLLKQVIGLISHKRQVKRFIPSVEVSA